MKNLFDLAVIPGPGRPNKDDVTMYWEYAALYGSFEMAEIIVSNEPLRMRSELMQQLRRRFPGWTPRRADGRIIEAYSEQKLSELLRMSWERDMGNFERNVLDYIVQTLDEFDDRVNALRFLIENYRARITPIMIFCALFTERFSVENPMYKPQSVLQLLREVWFPCANPDRDSIVRDATTLQRTFGDIAMRFFVVATHRPLVKWPCDEDTAFLGALMDIKPDANSETLCDMLERAIPEGYQHMTAREIHRYLEPLWRRIQSVEFRTEVVLRYIATWFKEIPTDAGDRLVLAVQSAANQRRVIQAIIAHNKSTSFRAKRIHACVVRNASRIRDEVAPEDTPDDVTCIACKSNLRRICFIPCGHIVTCIECTAQCGPTCPMCRVPFTHAQPCVVPHA